MIRKKTVRKVSVKKLRDRSTVIVVESMVPAKDTLFPEELKQANALLEKIDLTDFINSPHKYLISG